MLSDTRQEPGAPSTPPSSELSLERQQRRHLWRSVLGLLSVVVTGVLGFRLIEGWSLGRSLYFTLITITTVGYGDEGISNEGRVFAMLLLVSGIGLASYTLALIVQSAVADPWTSRKKMQRKIDKLNGHVVLAGHGRMGHAIAEELARVRQPFVVLEHRQEAFERAAAAGHLVIQGDAGCDESLKSAGVDRARHLVAATDSEAVNILIVLSARALAPQLHIVARAEDDQEIRKLRLAGADEVVTPHRSGGHEVADRIARPGIAKFLARTHAGGSDVALSDLVVEAGAELDGHELGAYGREEGSGLSFVALERGDEPLRIPPRGSERLRAGDRLILAGDPVQVDRMCKRASTRRRAA